LEQGSDSYPAEIINFSEGGILCELEAQGGFNWFLPAMISLEILLEGATLKVAGLYSVAKRLMVVEANPDYSPRRIRLACRFISVQEESKKQLLQVFSVIEKQEGLFGHED